MESTNNSPDVSHSSLRLSERLATPYRSFSILRGFGELGTECILLYGHAYARMKRIQRSVTVRRLVVFLKPPDLLHFSLMAGAVHIARPTCTGVRRDAQHLSFCLCPGSGSACEAGTCAAHRDRVPRVARVSTAPPSCPHAPSGVRKATDGQPFSVVHCVWAALELSALWNGAPGWAPGEGALDSARAPTPAQCTSRQHGLPDRRRRSEVVFVIIHHVSTTVRLYVVHDGRIHTQTKIHSQRAASDWKSTRLRTAPPMRPQWPPPNHDPSFRKVLGFC